jgi:eukaryotic-like serine/threonine-protein kinase
VQSFTGPGAKWPVSTHGGTGPRWRADGRELYFLAPDATMMAAPVMASSAAFEAGAPQPLFVSHVVGGGSSNGWQYVVGRDGRFLINQPAAAEAAAPITLLLNWQPATK